MACIPPRHLPTNWTPKFGGLGDDIDNPEGPKSTTFGGLSMQVNKLLNLPTRGFCLNLRLRLFWKIESRNHVAKTLNSVRPCLSLLNILITCLIIPPMRFLSFY